MKLGECDLILGVNWIWEHIPITFNLKENKIIIGKDKKEILLEGDPLKQEMRVINLYKATHGVMVHLFNVNDEISHIELIYHQLLAVLKKYEEVFSEPKGLPPQRSIEHEIILKPDTQLIFQRAYRYSHALKNEIEKMVKDMLL